MSTQVATAPRRRGNVQENLAGKAFNRLAIACLVLFALIWLFGGAVLTWMSIDGALIAPQARRPAVAFVEAALLLLAGVFVLAIGVGCLALPRTYVFYRAAGVLLEDHTGPTRRGRSPVPGWLNPAYGGFLGVDLEALRVRAVLARSARTTPAGSRNRPRLPSLRPLSGPAPPSPGRCPARAPAARRRAGRRAAAGPGAPPPPATAPPWSPPARPG